MNRNNLQMTPKQARFVSEYLIDFNGKQAAIRAGYKPSNAESTASALLRDPKVSQAVENGRAQLLTRNAISADRVMEELRRLAFSDVRELFDETGHLRPLHELTPDQSAAIASLEVVKRNLTSGDQEIDTIHKLKVWDKTRSLELLAKHFGLFDEKHQHSGTIAIRHELD